MGKLDEPGLEISPDVLVIGGGPAASWAALARRRPELTW